MSRRDGRVDTLLGYLSETVAGEHHQVEGPPADSVAVEAVGLLGLGHLGEVADHCHGVHVQPFAGPPLDRIGGRLVQPRSRRPGQLGVRHLADQRVGEPWLADRRSLEQPACDERSERGRDVVDVQ